MSSAAPQHVIEVFADLSCPFTQAGLHRWFDRRTELGRVDVALRVRAWPLELINGSPLTGEGIAHKVAALSVGFPDLFAGFSVDSFPATTLPALHLSHAAARVDLATGEQVAQRLRDLLFIDGRDIADPGVLDSVAREFNIPPLDDSDLASVEEDLAEGRRRGVIGSPHYFGPGFDAFCPGLTIDHVGEELDITAAADKFTEFIERCFTL